KDILGRTRRAAPCGNWAVCPPVGHFRAMLYDRLAQDLYAEICHIPLIDPHSHIDPRRPTAQSLDDILGYHYYTELAHSAGMDKGPLAPGVDARERVRSILYHMTQFDNT